MNIPNLQTIRDEWGLAAEIFPNLWRIRLNNTLGPLTVNTYAYINGTTSFVIDPGWPWTLEYLKEALKSVGIGGIEGVDLFMYTHTHPDHMGLAAILSQEYGAQHLVPGTIPDYDLDHWNTFTDNISDWADWEINAFAGVAREEARRRRSEEPVELRRFMVPTFGDMAIKNRTPMHDGDTFDVAGLTLHWVYVPGHDLHHIAIHAPQHGWIVTGDVVLATPTPFFSFTGDDVGQYLTSIDKIISLQPTLLLPGHGTQRAGDLSKMFARARDYVLDLDQKIFTMLDAFGSPTGLYEIAMATSADDVGVRGKNRWLWYVGRVEAQIMRQIQLGTIKKIDDEDGPRYQLL